MRISELKQSLTHSWRQGVFILTLLLILPFNIRGLRHELGRIRLLKLEVPQQDIEYKFAGLKPFTQVIAVIGYYTDLPVLEKSGGKEFSHAQFVLAPTILEYNNLNHEYILLVCSREELAWQKMKEIGAEPLRRSPFGMILAKRERPPPP